MTKLIRGVGGSSCYGCCWLGGSDSLIIVGEKIEGAETWGVKLTEDQIMVGVANGLFPGLVRPGVYGDWGMFKLRSCNDGSLLYYHTGYENYLLIVGKSVPRPDLLNMPIGPHDAAVIVPRELVEEKKCSVV